jgi:hypothetical protein
VIARYGTGVDIVDVAAATRMGVQVTNAPNDWCADEVADHATALLLALIRKVEVYNRQTRAGVWHWNSSRPIHRMRGSILGLLSFGSIAHRVAERMAAFGAKIHAHDPFQSDDEIRARGAVPPGQLRQTTRNIGLPGHTGASDGADSRIVRRARAQAHEAHGAPHQYCSRSDRRRPGALPRLNRRLDRRCRIG